MPRTLIPAQGARLEVIDEGSGDPVVFVQTALTADELVPLAERVCDGSRTIGYHRRGYARSSPVHGPGSVARDAADCRHIIAVLGWGGSTSSAPRIAARSV